MEGVKKLAKDYYQIEIPIYGRVFTVATSRKSAKKNCKVILTKEHAAAVHYFKSDPPLMIVPRMDLNDLAHETTHIALWVCKKSGIYYLIDDQETFAYLMGYIFERVAWCVNESTSNPPS